MAGSLQLFPSRDGGGRAAHVWLPPAIPRDRARLKLTGVQVGEDWTTRFQAGAGRRQ
jgi:hypothetical protein